MSTTVHIPPDLHMELKIVAAKRGVSLQALVEDALRASLPQLSKLRLTMARKDRPQPRRKS
jgi:plasmid stability protein